MNLVVLEGTLARPADLRAGASGKYYLFNTLKCVEEFQGKTYTSYVPFKAFGDVAVSIAENGSNDAKIKLIGKIKHGKNERSGLYETEIFVNKVDGVNGYLPPASNESILDGVEVDSDDLPF